MFAPTAYSTIINIVIIVKIVKFVIIVTLIVTSKLYISYKLYDYYKYYENDSKFYIRLLATSLEIRFAYTLDGIDALHLYFLS